MDASNRAFSEREIGKLLEQRGIKLTSQRIEIARLLLERWTHLSAEEVYTLVNANIAAGGNKRRASKATVYNTLGLFARKGLIREVIADPSKVFYDPNTKPHYHYYDETSGTLSDIEAGDVDIVGLPALPEGMELRGVDVVVRVRTAS